MPAAIAVVGIAASMYSANRASQQQRDAMNQAQRNQDKAFAMSEEQYQEEKSLRAAAQAPLWQAINTPGSLDYGARESSIKKAFQDAGTATDRNIANAGLQGSGLDQALKQGNKLEQGKALASAWNQGLIDKRAIAEKLAGTFNPTAAGFNASRTAENGARLWGDRAAMAGAAGRDAGNTVGGIVRGLQQLPAGSWDWLKPTQAPSPGADPTTPDVSFNGESGMWNWQAPAFSGSSYDVPESWGFDMTGTGNF